MDSLKKIYPDPTPNHIAIVWLWVCTVLLVLPTAIALGLTFFTQKQYVSIVMMVFAASAAGGFVSALRRVYVMKDMSFPPGSEQLHLRMRNLVVIAYSSIPPTVGALAGLAVFLAFAGGLIAGPMFPTFVCRSPSGACDDFVSFLIYYQPDSPLSYSKALFWAFISGFSEKFVANSLDQIATIGSGMSVPTKDGA